MVAMAADERAVVKAVVVKVVVVRVAAVREAGVAMVARAERVQECAYASPPLCPAPSTMHVCPP